MWILWKLRFQKCEFCEKWDFKNVNFVKNEISERWILYKLDFQCVNFWIKCGFSPQCEQNNASDWKHRNDQNDQNDQSDRQDPNDQNDQNENDQSKQSDRNYFIEMVKIIKLIEMLNMIDAIKIIKMITDHLIKETEKLSNSVRIHRKWSEYHNLQYININYIFFGRFLWWFESVGNSFQNSARKSIGRNKRRPKWSKSIFEIQYVIRIGIGPIGTYLRILNLAEFSSGRFYFWYMDFPLHTGAKIHILSKNPHF